ncbi:hypothetical protein [Agromyces aureus]|nr:hypothetical protein [Agromyces aureus]
MMETPSLAQVRRVLERTLIVTGGELTAAMRDQISALRAVSGPVTMLELDIPSEVQKIVRANGPYRSMSNDAQVEVVDESGDAIGGILLWVEDGRLITLEYYWYTDDPPLELPTVQRIVCATSRQPIPSRGRVRPKRSRRLRQLR